MRTRIDRTVIAFIGLLVAGCGGMPAMPTEPVNLTGTWSGVIGQGSGGGNALRVTWTAAQNGMAATGPVSVLTSPPVIGERRIWSRRFRAFLFSVIPGHARSA